MKSSLKFERFDANIAAHIEAAALLEEWTAEEAGLQMLPLNFDALKAHALGYLAFNTAQDDLVGYRGVTKTYPDNCYEVGGLVVREELRGQGYGSEIATFVFGEACREFPGSKFVIFANPDSIGINKKLGFTEIEDFAQVPVQAFEYCVADCPKYKCAQQAGKLCCDTIMVYYND